MGYPKYPSAPYLISGMCAEASLPLISLTSSLISKCLVKFNMMGDTISRGDDIPQCIRRDTPRQLAHPMQSAGRTWYMRSGSHGR